MPFLFPAEWTAYIREQSLLAEGREAGDASDGPEPLIIPFPSVAGPKPAAVPAPIFQAPPGQSRRSAVPPQFPKVKDLVHALADSTAAEPCGECRQPVPAGKAFEHQGEKLCFTCARRKAGVA